MSNHSNKKQWVRWTGIGLLSIVLLYFILPIPDPLFKEEYSTVVQAQDGSLLHVFTNAQEQWLLPPDTMTVPEKLKTAVITFEDESFYRHPGVNLQAVFRAIGQNVKKGKVKSGASTITMQVARMANPKKRTYFNKLREIIFALKLSLHYSKAEVLKLYLDHAPYGGNVIGYRTASYRFFGKEARYLTWSEAATLAVLPNAPGLIYPSRTSSRLVEKRDLLLKKLYEKGQLSEQSYRLAKLETVPDRFISFDSKAPHLARKLKNTYPGKWILHTTIDEHMQVQCNRIADRYKNIYESYGINNLAILIADTKSGAVKAYVGSPAFFDFQHSGQVDGVMAPRSSGSTLKPFLYGLCMDEGLIAQDSYLRDLPTYFEGFSPMNANREFQGVVTAREALVQSLNIPAVRLLNIYGTFQFYSFLKLAGVSTLFRTADEYGLPLILGGSEVNVWDMVMLYRGLANRGVFSNNVLLEDEKVRQSAQLISAGSCYLTMDILKDLKRPGSEYFWERFSGSRPIAWKTGTSYANKDAWAIGVTPKYTIAVWVGNFSGEGNKNLSGATTAGPILFDILQFLPQRNSKEWFSKQPRDYKRISICVLSGYRATEACPEQKVVDVPYGMSPLKACEYHQFKYFSMDGNYQCCSQCWQNLGSVRKSVTCYPPDIAYYLREKGQFPEPVVAHYPNCPAYSSENSLKIIYPNMDAKLFLPRDFDGKTQAVLCKVGHVGTNKRVFWYLDGHFLGTTTESHTLGILFKEGWNQLKVVDENGAEDSRKVYAVTK